MKQAGFDAFLNHSSRSTGPTQQSRSREELFLATVDKYLWDLNNKKRRSDGFHCSSVCYTECARALYYEITGAPGEFEEAWIEPAMRKIMDNGTGVHTRWQEYLSNIPDVQLLGRWQCRRCLDRTDRDKEVLKPNYYCVNCNSYDWEYAEFRLEEPELRLVGRRDGKIIISGKKYLLEIKSMRTEMFRNLTRPMDPHIRQIGLYLRMDPEGIEDAMFLYENKNDQKVKIFFYHYNENDIADVLGRLRMANDGLEDNTPPVRLPGFPRSPVCRKCIFRNTCKQGVTT